jgi:dTDP-4-amino-4,6-dideoxygalactose transaminase
MITNHGQSRQYYHDIVGCNSRLDSVQAAILDIKLRHLDDYIHARRSAADYYDGVFSGHPAIRTPYRAAYCRHVFHQYTIILDKEGHREPAQAAAFRDGLKTFLASAGIPSMIYYPVPGHKQKMFAHVKVAEQSMPVTDWLTARVISLPIHTELDKEQLDFISSKVMEYVNK